jgi:hypothetical protein
MEAISAILRSASRRTRKRSTGAPSVDAQYGQPPAKASCHESRARAGTNPQDRASVTGGPYRSADHLGATKAHNRRFWRDIQSASVSLAVINNRRSVIVRANCNVLAITLRDRGIGVYLSALREPSNAGGS